MDTEQSPKTETPAPNPPVTPVTMPTMTGKGPAPRKSVIVRVLIILAILTFVALGTLLVLSLSNTASDTLKVETVNPLREGIDETKSFDKDTSATFGYFEMTINDVTRGYKPDNGSMPSKPSDEFILLNISAKNTDQAPHLLSDIDLAVLADKTLINASFVSIDSQFKSTSVEPGATVTGNLLFSVPSDATDLKLYYNTQIYSEEKQKLVTSEYTLAF